MRGRTANVDPLDSEYLHLVNPRNNLPVALTSLIGREREIAEVGRLLGTTRLLTLTGAPGVGKTRLALEVAGQALDKFDDGAWLVELAPLADAELVPQAVATALGVREPPGRMLRDALADALRPQHVLLVLDNCEHLVGACAGLADSLLRSAPALTILATSREALRLDGETTWWVPSLAVPDPDTFSPGSYSLTGGGAVASLMEYDAVQLFAARAQAALPTFTVTERDVPTVASMCRRLDGIPLALELAAARVRGLGVDQLAQRLDDRFRILVEGRRTALPRQQTLGALVDWSYALLAESERMLFRRLSVFAGGWTLEAAEGICGGGGLEEGEVLPVLLQLVDKSLVLADDHEGASRYRFLETLRHYSAERLREAGEDAAVHARHVEWFAALARQADGQLQTAEQEHWLRRLEAEHDNLRAALSWLRGTGDLEAGVRLGGALAWFWMVRGYLTEGRRWLGPGLAAGDAVSAAARAQALYGDGILLFSLGDFGETAAAHFEESLALFRDLGDKAGIAHALGCLGLVAHAQGDDERAVALYQEGLGLAREVGDRWGIAKALCFLGEAASAQSQYEQATPMLEESLALHRELSDAVGITWSLGSLAWVARARGDPQRAGALLRERLVVQWKLGDRLGIVISLSGLGGVAKDQRDWGRAAQLFGTAHGLREALGASLGLVERVTLEPDLAATRAGLGEEAFEEAWARGRALPLEQAIADVMASAEPAPAPTSTPARPSRAAIPGGLSRRELEVAILLAEGLTNRQIADALVITEWTAESHVRHIFTKLGLHSRAQVAAWARSQELPSSQGL